MLDTLRKKTRKSISFTSIVVGMLLIFISQYFAYVNVINLTDQNRHVNNTIRVLNQTANLAYVIKELQSNIRGYIITDNEKSLINHQSVKLQVKAISDTLSSLVAYSEEQTRRVDEVREISDEFLLFSQKTVSVYQQSGPKSAANLVRSGQGVRLFNALKNKLDEIDRFENIQLDLHRIKADKTEMKTIMQIIGTGLAGFLITLLSIVFLFQDRVKQRKLKREIYRKERQVSQYLDAIPDGIMVVNPQQEIILINPSGKELLGIEDMPKDLNALLEKFSTFDKNANELNINSLSLTKALQGNKIENRVSLHIKGSQVDFETSAKPVFDLNNEITGAIAVFRDITALEKYANDLKVARDTAEQSIRIKDVFLANISHEIRTPLNAILGFTYLLEGEVKEETSLEYINYIQIAGRNLLDLINDILDVSKLEVGQFQLDEHPTSLRDLASSVSVLINQRAKEKGIVYKHIVSDNLPDVIVTDKLRLTQILLNLCGNAVKFTEKGSVTLIIEEAAEIINSEQRIRFIIKDTGIGIAENKIEKIFDRFVQASESTTRKFGGTGLGLSIVKSLVHLLAGSLKVESTLNEGTTFTIEFPFTIITDFNKPDYFGDDPATKLQPSKLKLLAAEDNLLNQKLLKAVFERLGSNITVVSNGLEAVNKLREETFDVVLMDIQMPEMDGYTAIKKIRNELGLTTPIITMTAHAMPGEKDECLRIGASSYISKPFKESEVIAEIFKLTHKETAPDTQKNDTLMNKLTNSGSSYVDIQYLNEITGGDASLRTELISLFQQESKKQLYAISEAMHENEMEALRKAIHKYRSSLISVGLLATAGKYKEIETELISNSSATNLYERIRDLESEVKNGLDELEGQD